jgi:hypothetical protein
MTHETYIQNIKSGDVILYRGHEEIVKTVTLLSGHTDTYELLTDSGRKIRFYAGDHVVMR